MRSGGEHFDLEVAVEVRRRKEEGGPADIKSNKPHLTGGDNKSNLYKYIYMSSTSSIPNLPFEPSVELRSAHLPVTRNQAQHGQTSAEARFFQLPLGKSPSDGPTVLLRSSSICIPASSL